MTTQQHPITPPPELVEQWRATPEYTDLSEKLFLVTLTTKKLQDIATQAARWGADQELKACYEWVVRDWTDIQSADMLLAARRPKPLSPRELALATLRKLSTSSYPCNLQQDEDWDTIRQALEQLDD